MTVSDQVGYLFDYGCKDLSNFIGTETNPAYGGALILRKTYPQLSDLVDKSQSYYEAIVSAGANFASAPKRVLIDMMDPLIVAETIAYTPVDKYIPLANILSNTREGINGIGGLQTRGQLRTGMPGM